MAAGAWLNGPRTLLLYHGVLAPRAAWRSEVVTHLLESSPNAVPDESRPVGSVSSRGRGWRWAHLMRRVFALDVLA